MQPPDPATVRCPTCRAVQPWADDCRRCRSDLRLLREVAEAYWQARRRCLHRLRDGRPASARRAAERCHALAPSEETRRLLAVSALLSGDLAAAASAGLPVPDDRG